MSSHIDRTIHVVPGRTHPDAFALFCPAELRHRESENRAWWYGGVEQSKEAALYTFGVGRGLGAPIEIRVTTGELSELEARHARHEGTAEIVVGEGGLHLGAMEELPSAGDNRRGPDGAVAVPPGRYAVDHHEIRVPRRTRRAITSAALSPDGDRVVTVDTTGTLAVWDPAALALGEKTTFRAIGAYVIVGHGTDAPVLVGPDVRRVSLPDLGLKRVRKRGADVCAAVGPGLVALASRKQVTLFDPATRQDRRTTYVGDAVVGLDPTPDGVAAGLQSGGVVVLDLDLKPRGAVPAGGRLTTAVGDDLVLFDAAAQATRVALSSGAVRWCTQLTSVATTARVLDDRVVVGCDDGTLVTVDLASGRPLAQLRRPLGAIVGIHPVSEGRLLAVAEEGLSAVTPDLTLLKSKRVIRRSPGVVYPGELPRVVLRLSRRGD